MRAGRVIEVLARHIDTGYLSGAVALIGRGAHAEVVAVGNRSLEQPGLMQRESIFRITSMTKPITAVATLQLIDEGTLRLDERIDPWLPELRHRRVLRHIDAALDDTVPARRPITVEDLLTFRCGLGVPMSGAGDYPIQRRIAELQLLGFGPPNPASPVTPDEWLRRLGTLPLMAQPGDAWLYNTGSYILGVLIARAARKPLPQLLEERIFAPLGMKDTAFSVPPAKRERLVSAYRIEAGHARLDDDPATSPWTRTPTFPDAAAGLVSTVDDFFALSYALLNLGRFAPHRLVSRDAVAAMTRDYLTPSQRAAALPFLGTHRGWGFGTAIVTETTPQGVPPGAYGWNGGFGTSWVADPASGTTAILLTQTLFSSPLPPAVHQEFWSAVFAPPVL
ncbi:MAG: beta-lactamase family protein [Gammaproteobacteria bacterium]|nr:beta-lactamase family protein [Gammaproteobacteria bacterium]MBV8308544.1 beta-lactamase family protein [Gammaproteobacteria bacterium]